MFSATYEKHTIGQGGQSFYGTEYVVSFFLLICYLLSARVDSCPVMHFGHIPSLSVSLDHSGTIWNINISLSHCLSLSLSRSTNMHVYVCLVMVPGVHTIVTRSRLPSVYPLEDNHFILSEDQVRRQLYILSTSTKTINCPLGPATATRVPPITGSKPVKVVFGLQAKGYLCYEVV